MRDRLAELNQGQHDIILDAYRSDGGESGIQYENIDIVVDDEDDPLNNFNQISNTIRDNLKQIDDNNNLIRNIYQVFLQKNSDSDNSKYDLKSQKVSNELDGLLKKNNSLSITTKNMIDSLTNNSSSNLSKTEIRIRETVHSQQIHKFAELMITYKKIQQDFSNKITNRVKRNIQIVYPDYTDEKIDKMIDEGDIDIFQQDILYDKDREEAENRFNYIRDRHNDIVKLEKSIRELHELFIDMAFLVSEQGEMVTQISTNIGQTRAYVRDSTFQLKSANILQKKSRRKMCCIIAIIVIIVLIVVLVPVIVSQIKT